MSTVDDLLSFIRKEFPDAKSIGPDDPLLQGAIDSLGVFNVVGFVENNFGVSLDDSELTTENFGSVRVLANLIETKRAASR